MLNASLSLLIEIKKKQIVWRFLFCLLWQAPHLPFAMCFYYSVFGVYDFTA